MVGLEEAPVSCQASIVPMTQSSINSQHVTLSARKTILFALYRVDWFFIVHSGIRSWLYLHVSQRLPKAKEPSKRNSSLCFKHTGFDSRFQKSQEKFFFRLISLSIFLGSKLTAYGDCSHEIKRCLLLGRKAMTNLDSLLKAKTFCWQMSI